MSEFRVPKHQTARIYARALEIVGYVIAVVGGVAGVATMVEFGFFAGIGEFLIAIGMGLGLVVLGELVLVFFNIEYNTMFLRNLQSDLRVPPRQETESDRTAPRRSEKPPPTSAH